MANKIVKKVRIAILSKDVEKSIKALTDFVAEQVPNAEVFEHLEKVRKWLKH